MVCNHLIHLHCVQAFEKAMNLRFSMIDVNKSLRISRTKGAEDKLKLVNKTPYSLNETIGSLILILLLKIGFLYVD